MLIAREKRIPLGACDHDNDYLDKTYLDMEVIVVVVVIVVFGVGVVFIGVVVVVVGGGVVGGVVVVVVVGGSAVVVVGDVDFLFHAMCEGRQRASWLNASIAGS